MITHCSQMTADFQHLVEQLVEGDEDAATEVVEAYYHRLLPVARRHMQSLPTQVGDDEGAVVSAFRSFFSAIRRDRFPELDEPDNLWRILATFTARKAIRQVRRHWKVSGEGLHVDRLAEVSRVLSPSPTPADVAGLLDECEVALSRLEDEQLRDIAILRLQGLETAEIAERFNVHQRTIQRKLNLIKSVWSEVAEL